MGDSAAHPEPDDGGLSWEEVVDAAEQAELAARPDESPAEVRSHLIFRVARMSLASAILLAGVAMLALPGPGWLVIAAGLALLARDVAWAERLLVGVRRRIPGAQPDGSLPRGMWATIIVMALAGVAASIWFVVR